MNRLTQRIREHIEVEDVNAANHKLADLEDLEEKLGCPLEVVFKAFTNGIYRYSPSYEPAFRKEEVLYIGKNGKDFGMTWLGCWYERFKDYKKTWWLKEDRSE